MNFFSFLFYLLLTINVVMSTCLLLSKTSNQQREFAAPSKGEVTSDLRQTHVESIK